MIIVGSATPTINKGCPPTIECMMPHIAVDANVSTVVSLPFVAVLSCSPKAITGSAEAKKIYMVGANILKPERSPATQSCLYQAALPLTSAMTPLKGLLSRSIIGRGAAAAAEAGRVGERVWIGNAESSSAQRGTLGGRRRRSGPPLLE